MEYRKICNELFQKYGGEVNKALIKERIPENKWIKMMEEALALKPKDARQEAAIDRAIEAVRGTSSKSLKDTLN